MIEKRKIHLTIIPSYKTNDLTCLSFISDDRSILDLSNLNLHLEDIDRQFIINKIDIRPANISELSDTYFDLLYHLCLTFTLKVSVWTNLLTFSKSIVNACDMLNVPYHFDLDKERKKKIADNIKAIESNGKVINLKSFDIWCTEDEKDTIKEINNLGVQSWEIIPWHGIYNYTYPASEDIIKKYLDLSKLMNFAFQNELQLDGVLLEENYSENKVYILPNNKLAIMSFDEDNRFSFKELKDAYQLNYELGKIDGKRSSLCKDCNYKLWCLANYYLNLDYTGKSCSGMKDLIKLHRGVRK